MPKPQLSLNMQIINAISSKQRLMQTTQSFLFYNVNGIKPKND